MKGGDTYQHSPNRILLCVVDMVCKLGKLSCAVAGLAAAGQKGSYSNHWSYLVDLDTVLLLSTLQNNVGGELGRLDADCIGFDSG
jgi:hypothetical protein